MNFIFRFPGATLALLMLVAVSCAHAQGASGSISGRVLNEATGEFLKYAVIQQVGTDRFTTAGAGGEFMLANVPAGPVRIRATYTALDPVEATVTVVADGTVTHDFNLTSKDYQAADVVKLGVFVVATEKEGQAKALMDQRAALNSKSVLSTDAYGQVAEGNVAEFLKYLPGMSLDYRESDVTFVRIRGFDPQYTGVMMDGNPVANPASTNITNTANSTAGSANAQGRGFEFETMSINNIETIEVTKVPLADADATSGAGIVNMKSKRAFDRKGRSIVWNYSLVANSLLPLTLGETGGPRNRLTHAVKPSASFGYADVFFQNRLGVTIDLGTSNTISMMQRANSSWTFNNNPGDNATEVPFMSAVEFKDGPKATNRKNGSLTLDYRLTPNAFVGFRFNVSTFNTYVYDRLFNLNSGGLDATQTNTLSDQYAIASTSTHARFRGAGFFPKNSRTINLSIPFEYKRGGLTVDGSFAKSIGDNWYPGNLLEDTSIGNPQVEVNNIRWRVQIGGVTSAPYYNFTQLTGPGGAAVSDANSILKLGNYSLSSSPFSFNTGYRHGTDTLWSASSNVTYKLPEWKVPTILRTGYALRARNYHQLRTQIGYTYVPTGAAVLPMYNFPEDKFPLVIGPLTNLAPQYPSRFDIASFLLPKLSDPAYFTRTAAQLAADEQFYWQNKQRFDEDTYAAYGMATFKFGKLDVIPGMRFEHYKTEGVGSADIGDRQTRQRLGLPALPLGTTSAAADVNTVAYRRARYSDRASASAVNDDLFANFQLRYRWTENLQLLGAYRESVQRPSAGFMLPGITGVNEAAVPYPTVTVNNPDLKPEFGRTFNLGGDYYFEPAGSIGLYWFRQDFKNKVARTAQSTWPIAGPEGVYGDADYAGYQVNSPINVPNPVHLTGLEFSYRQQLRFLPGALRGLGVAANFTYLRPDSLTYFPNTQSRTASGQLSYRHRRIFFQNNFTWSGVYPVNTPNATTGVQGYREARFQVDSSLSFDVTKNIQISLFARNLFNEPDVYFLTKERHIVNSFTRYGTYWSLGVRGRY